MRFGLDRMRRLLTEVGEPQRGRPTVHVVGTNGKSSTTRFTAAALQSTGLRVGTYLSPHVTHWRERIQIDGIPVSASAFADAVGRVADVAATFASDDPVTQFEVLTAAAFVVFAQAAVDRVVMEAGLGGRYDATNVLDEPVVVLTTVGREHTDLLGTTEYAIAGEKLAVADDGGDRLVIGALTAPALVAVSRIARERRLSGWWMGRQIRVTPRDDGFTVETPLSRHHLTATIPGAYQRANVATAIAAAERRENRPLDTAALDAALARVENPGRFEVRPGNPSLILDGAHNPAGMEVLARELPADRRVVAVLSALRDKDLPAMLAPLVGRVAVIVATVSTNARARPATEVARSAAQAGITAETVENPSDAVARAQHLAGPDGVVVICGSLYLLADLRDPGPESPRFSPW